MIPELDVWRAVNLLIREHSDDAANRVDLMLDRGDDDGRLSWARIRLAITALQAQPSGGKVN